MPNQLVSIIIPTYNRVQIVGKAIESVMNQTYQYWECIVVDDGSTDTSMSLLNALAQRDRRIKIYKRERGPKGAPTCRNIGLEHAKGNYIIFLDSDDYLLSFCLKQRVEQFLKFPDFHFLVFPMGEQKKTEIIKREIPESNNYLIHFLSANLLWQTMCPIWKRDFLVRLHGFTEGYPRFNDPELMIRALLCQPLYKVFINFNYDSVHFPSNKETNLFIDNVHKSLIIFVKDITKQLDLYEQQNYKHYLSLYLHLWFKYICVPLKIERLIKSIKLIQVFYKNGILSFLRAIKITLFLFLYSFSKIIFKSSYNKLSDKSIYV